MKATTFWTEGGPCLNCLLENDWIIMCSILYMDYIAHTRQNNCHVKIPPSQKEVPCQHYCFPHSPRLQHAGLDMAPHEWHNRTQKDPQQSN